MIAGTIYSIQRFSLQDGPGIRTTVFFKGCPLSCLWCSNPESQRPDPQLMIFSDQCKRCGRCAEVCPNRAVSRKGEEFSIDRSLCKACGICVPACLNDARSISGKTMTVEEVLAVVRKDWIYYQNSGGGMTVSGGEPTFQPAFLQELLEAANAEGLHTCLDTCGFTRWENLERILPYLNLILFDCKHMDPDQHKRLTGVDNALILQNLVKLARHDVPVRIRIPLIPGYNSSPENILTTGEFVKSLGFKEVDVIPFHQLGLNKYGALGKQCQMEDKREPQVVIDAVKTLETTSLRVSVI